MLKYKTAKYSDLIKAKRIDSKFFFLHDKLEKYMEDDDLVVMKLGDEKLLKTMTDGEHAGQKFVDDGVLFLRNSSIKNFHISRYEGFYIEEWKHQELSRSALQKGDILFTTVGHLGACTIVPEGFGEANINQNLVRMVINPEVIDPYYLVVYLNSGYTKMQIEAVLTGNIHSILTYPKIKKLSIIYPKDKSKVEEIAQYAKKAEKFNLEALNIIENVKERYKKTLGIDLYDVPESKYYSIPASGLNNSSDLWIPKYFYPTYVNMLKKIKENFNTVPLAKLSIIAGNEPGSANYTNYIDKSINDFPFIRTSDVFNYEIDLYPDNYIPREIAIELNQDIKQGDVLFTKDGKIGIVAMHTGEDVVLSSGICRLRSKKGSKITNEYIFASLLIDEVCQYQINQRVVFASTIPHLRMNRIKEIEIPILPDEEIQYITKEIRKAFEYKKKKNELLKNAVGRLKEILG